MKKKEVIVSVISFIVILIIIHIFVDKINKEVYMEVSIAGTAASLFGLILVWVQVGRLKSLAEESDRATKQTKDQLMSFLAAIDIGKALKVVQETQIYNRGKKYELSIVRMQELREILIFVRNHPRYSTSIDTKHFNKLIGRTSVDICSMEKSVFNRDENIDPVFLNANLDSILAALNDLQSKVKLAGV